MTRDSIVAREIRRSVKREIRRSVKDVSRTSFDRCIDERVLRT